LGEELLVFKEKQGHNKQDLEMPPLDSVLTDLASQKQIYIQRTKSKNMKDSFKNMEPSIRNNKLQWNDKCGSEQPTTRRERLIQQSNTRKKMGDTTKKKKYPTAKNWKLRLDNKEFEEWRKNEKRFNLFSMGHQRITQEKQVQVIDPNGKTITTYEWSLEEITNNKAEAYNLLLGTRLLKNSRSRIL